MSERDKLADQLCRIEARGEVRDGLFEVNSYSLADAILSLPWLAEHDRLVAEKAWDEGFDRGFYNSQTLPRDADASEALIPNPYARHEPEEDA